MKRRSLAFLGLAGLVLAAAAVPLLSSGAARSQASAAVGTFVIAANDGYGVADCLTGQAACGKVIADAYCESQGYRQATAYGPVSAETTGSISRVAVSDAPISISCKK